MIYNFQRPLRQTASWDTPNSATSTPHRTLSCDTSTESNRNSSIISEEIPLQLGISASSSEHDNQEAGAWSSDYSNSEDEFTNIDENVTPVSFFYLNQNLLYFYFIFS